jgi:hypothetical protein
MNAPTSSILAETYIQHMEYTQISPILITQEIIAYFRFDDILIIYVQNKTYIIYLISSTNYKNHKLHHRKRTTIIH